MALIVKQFRGLFIALFCTFALFGTSMTIVGAALPRIFTEFKWSDATAGAVIAASAAAYVVTSLLSGIVLKRIGAKASVAAGLAACVIGLSLFASTPSFFVNFLLNALVGAGQGLIEPAVNWSTIKMDEKGSGKPMNLMHGAFAVGAVAGPIVLGLIMASGLSWTLLFRVIAILFGAIGIAILAMPFARLGNPVGERTASSVANLRRNPAYWLGFLCLLLYVGAELGISNWIAAFFVRVFGAEPAFASLSVSLFWIGLLAGRFGVPAIYRGERQEAVLVASCLLLVSSVVGLSAMSFLPKAEGGLAFPLWAPAIATFLAGLGCSIVYPTVVSLVGIACGESQTEALSFSIAGGGVGLFAFPFLMSWISQGWGIKAGFASYAFVAMLTAASCAALAKVFAKSRKA